MTSPLTTIILTSPKSILLTTSPITSINSTLPTTKPYTTLITTKPYIIKTTVVNVIPETTIIKNNNETRVFTTNPQTIIPDIDTTLINTNLETTINFTPIETINTTINSLTTIISTNPEILTTIPETTHISSNPTSSINIFYCLLGIGSLIHNIDIKKVTFNLYFIKTNSNLFFYDYIVINLRISYIKFRRLQNSLNFEQTTNANCNLTDDEFINHVKYECEFESIGETSNELQLLEILESSSHKFFISNMGLVLLLYQDNLINVEKDIFDKPLFILNNSETTENEKEFNITGNLLKSEINFDYKELVLEYTWNQLITTVLLILDMKNVQYYN